MKWIDIQKLAPIEGQQPDFQACLAAFPALEFSKTTPQGSYHREGDVWTHTKMVVEALLSLPDYQSATRVEQVIVFLAALLHDVAKYSTTVVDPVTGEVSQPGHSRKGAVDARIALWDAGVPFVVREAVCRLISVHQVPFFAFDASRRRKQPESIVRALSWQLSIPLLALLAEADIRGRICDDQQSVLDNIELFRELAREDGCYGQPKSFVDAHTRLCYFRGANVHPDYPLFQEEGSRVIVMSGMPASGKNTWVEKNHPTLPVVSYDDTRAELGLKYGKNEGLVAHRTVDKARALLREKAPFVWNATHLSEQHRTDAIDLLLAYHAEIELVYVEQPRSVLLTRNNKRDTSLSNKALEAMIFKWEVPLPTESHSISYVVNK